MIYYNYFFFFSGLRPKDLDIKLDLWILIFIYFYIHFKYVIFKLFSMKTNFVYILFVNYSQDWDTSIIFKDLWFYLIKVCLISWNIFTWIQKVFVLASVKCMQDWYVQVGTLLSSIYINIFVFLIFVYFALNILKFKNCLNLFFEAAIVWLFILLDALFCWWISFYIYNYYC